MVLDAWSPSLPGSSMAMFMGMSVSSAVEAIMGVATAMAMVQILMGMSIVAVGMPVPDALMSVAMAVAVPMVEIFM